MLANRSLRLALWSQKLKTCKRYQELIKHLQQMLLQGTTSRLFHLDNPFILGQAVQHGDMDDSEAGILNNFFINTTNSQHKHRLLPFGQVSCLCQRQTHHATLGKPSCGPCRCANCYTQMSLPDKGVLEPSINPLTLGSTESRNTGNLVKVYFKHTSRRVDHIPGNRNVLLNTASSWRNSRFRLVFSLTGSEMMDVTAWFN